MNEPGPSRPGDDRYSPDSLKALAGDIPEVERLADTMGAIEDFENRAKELLDKMKNSPGQQLSPQEQNEYNALTTQIAVFRHGIQTGGDSPRNPRRAGAFKRWLGSFRRI